MNSKLMLIFICATFFFTPKIQASEKDVYEFSWLDPDKEVYVLQNRKFRKAGHLQFNLGGGITTSGAFVDATSLQGRAGYFFTEDLGIEGVFAKNSGKENSTALGVRNPGGAGSKPFRRIVENYTGAMLLWSPFYSKINTFNKIVYMDWIFGLGYAQLKENNNQRELLASGSDTVKTSETHSGIMWDLGLKFYLDESFSIRTDVTAVHYNAKNVTTTGSSYYSNFDTTISLGYAF